jgi:phage replication-related protein YjqB (UPF0714/DUF867 family)
MEHSFAKALRALLREEKNEELRIPSTLFNDKVISLEQFKNSKNPFRERSLNCVISKLSPEF